MSDFFSAVYVESDAERFNLPKGGSDATLKTKTESVELTLRQPALVNAALCREATPDAPVEFAIEGAEIGIVPLQTLKDGYFETESRLLGPGKYALKKTSRDENVVAWRLEKFPAPEPKKIGVCVCNHKLNLTVPYAVSLRNLMKAIAAETANVKKLFGEAPPNLYSFELYADRTDDGDWNFAAEMNGKILKAIEGGCDIIVAGDADSILSRRYWLEAARVRDDRAVVAKAADLPYAVYSVHGLTKSAENLANKIVAVAATAKNWKDWAFIEADFKAPFFQKLCDDVRKTRALECGDVVPHIHHRRRSSWRPGGDDVQYMNSCLQKTSVKRQDGVESDVKLDEKPAETLSETPKKKRATRKKRKEENEND
ncbi:MAG: hypothetical protein IJE77_12665 [Thermoguttaceae bacterium]|nr:hypothetical protein [Thermoguttaceae bacterium]